MKLTKYLISILLVTILIFSIIPMTNAITEFIDDYHNEYYVASKENITRNSELNAMELNFSMIKNRYELEGCFYTTNILSNISSLSILMTNTTLDSGIINVQFSDDNFTWVNHNNQNGYDTLIEGFDSIDLKNLNFSKLYIRFNFTRGGFFKTPRLYQIQIIYETGFIQSEDIGENGFNMFYNHIYNVSSINVILGTLNAGNLESTYFVDGDWYNVSEDNTAPALDIRFNFTDVEENVSCGCIEIYQTFTGTSQNDIKIEVWNFTSSSWKIIGTILYNEETDWVCIGLGHTPIHFFNAGNMWFRFYHEVKGSLAHELHVDRIDLRIVFAEDVNWLPPEALILLIFLLVIGSILVYGVSRRK